MTEDALDAAINEQHRYEAALDRIEEEKEQWENDEAAKKAEMEEQGRGDEYEYQPPPEKELPVKPDFETHNEQFVVCLDTLG